EEPGALETRDPTVHELVRYLGASSLVLVPIVVLGVPTAIATFAFAPESGRRHALHDLALAADIAHRAAQIIENARLHDQLTQSEARLRVALSRSNIGVFELDADLRLRWVYNAQVGADDPHPIGKTTRDWFPLDVSAQLDAVKRHVL